MGDEEKVITELESALSSVNNECKELKEKLYGKESEIANLNVKIYELQNLNGRFLGIIENLSSGKQNNK